MRMKSKVTHLFNNMSERVICVSNLTPVVNDIPVNVTVTSIFSVGSARALRSKEIAGEIVTPVIATFPTAVEKSCRKNITLTGEAKLS